MSGRGRVLVALALSIIIGWRAEAQDTGAHDRKPEPEVDRSTAGAGKGPGAASALNEPTRGLPTRYDPDDEWPPPDEPREPLAPGPGPEKPKEGEQPRSFLEGVEIKPDGRARLQLGYDTNVNRSPDARGGGFFHGLGEVEALARFKEGRELFLSLTGEGVAYLHRSNADEMYVSSFGEYFHPVTDWLDTGVQNTLEYSRQNLLDDNGDLLPRESFNAWDEEPRAFAIFHAGDQLSFEMGGAFRWKDFEEQKGKASLDFYEIRGDAAVRVKIPWWPDAKIKVKYRFRERRYKQLLALTRDGAVDLVAPKLTLDRHQVNTTFSQKLRPFETEITITLGYGFTYNQDQFDNDRSYREHAGSLRVEWWLVKEWTRLEGELRGGARDFIVRQTDAAKDALGNPIESSVLLRHRFLDVSFLVWQQVIEHLAVVAEASWFGWNSSEHGESYRRFVFQAGLEGSF